MVTKKNRMIQKRIEYFQKEWNIVGMHAGDHGAVVSRNTCASARCNTLQHTVAHRNTLQHGAHPHRESVSPKTPRSSRPILQHTATHFNTLQHNATHYATHCVNTTPHCNTLQHTMTHYRNLLTSCLNFQLCAPAKHCNTLQHTATTY